MKYLLSTLPLVLACNCARAFSPSLHHNSNKPRLSSSSLSVIDVAVAETVASAAAIPSLFVGTGTFLLNSDAGNDEEDRGTSILEEGDDQEVDIYRDTLLRYAGYANEVGEAFAPLVPAVVVPASYGVAITYVLADTIDKFRKSLKGGKYSAGASTKCAIIEGVDALIWQLAASVALPGYTIHQVVAITVTLLNAAGLSGDDQGPLLQALPTVLGLVTIPFIVKPLDEFAEVAMDVTFRKVSLPYLETCEIDYDKMP